MPDVTSPHTAHSPKPLLFSLALLLGACQTVPPTPVSNAKIDDVVLGIKKDLAQYETNAGIALARSTNEAKCADLAGFVITKVVVSLVVNTKTTESASGELTVPIFEGASIGPKYSTSTERAGTQTMAFSLYPLPQATTGERGFVGIEPDDFPITANLQALTDALVRVNQAHPCLSLVPLKPNGQPDKDDEGNAFAYGFNLTRKGHGSLDFKFVLFALGASRENERMVGNTIKVTFKGVTKQAAAAYLSR